MLFNSYEFLFLFLPVSFAFFYVLGSYSRALAALWLFAASLFFYGWWNPAYVSLLLASILFNYAVGMALAQAHRSNHGRKKTILILGTAANLGLLCYYKYANFFVSNANVLLDTAWQFENVILPLGISFFTFTQIAFLVDAYRGEVREGNFIHYGLFVTYFPHLIAGPVLHHKEMMPQFAQAKTYTLHWENISVGLTIFFIGLGKKVLLADGVAPYANPVFEVAARGEMLTLVEAWCGALAYTLQLYFDFSGYSDMAIGLSRLFGVHLPLNFNSPYKATSIIEFWRRWHITLSRFLRDYLYIALGGNRKGPLRRYANLLTTMLLGGLWHGAGWTFVVWGGLHGIYLIVNHAWGRLRSALLGNGPAGRLERLAAMLLTFLAVVVGWVFFRAESFSAALRVLEAMAGANGTVVPHTWPRLCDSCLWVAQHKLGMDIAIGTTASGFDPLGDSLYWIAALLAVAWFAPNTQQIMAKFKPALERVDASGMLSWAPTTAWALLTGAVGTLSLLHLSRVSEFLYFQF